MIKRKAKQKETAGWWRLLVLAVAIILLFVLSRVFGIGDKLGAVRVWIESLGWLGMVVFALIYIIATVAALPGSAVTIAAGALFGSIVGVVLVSIASTIGAALSFLIARYIARNAIVGLLSGNEKFTRLDNLTEKHGPIIVALTRLVPIFPFNLLNYGFGLTKVKFRDYVFWSWLCMLPGTILYVVGADAVMKGISQRQIPWILIAVAGVMLILITILVRQAHYRLTKKDVGFNGEQNSVEENSK